MEKPPVNIPEDLSRVSAVFRKHSRQCWLVGGAVRDGLLKRRSEDYDLATDAKPEEVIGMFRRTVPTGIRHGTVTILMGNHQFETTTFRKDGKYTDGRRPDKVSYSEDINEDLARRDFTINAIAWDLINNTLLDPHHGREDIKKQIIRAIGNPGDRFREDGLRSIRACRFSSQLGFSVHKDTLKAISENLSNISSLSSERIWEELKKILLSPGPSTAFNLFMETGLLEIILPELKICAGVEQKGRHAYDVFHHSLRTCDSADGRNLQLRAAALFHDIGKPSVKRIDEEGEITFHRHEIIGAEITEKILLRYKASNSDRNRICSLVRHHMFHYTSDWSDAAVRRFMARVNPDLLDDLIALRLADATSISPDAGVDEENLKELLLRIDGILASESALSIADLRINGKDLINKLDVKPGPVMGTLLNYLLDCVLEDPDCNEYERLVDMGKKWLDIYG